MQKKTVVLLILDGFGHNEETKNNAIAAAHTPYWNNLKTRYPHTLINASESFVGLPKGQMGNSEVGHLTIGSGRIIDQDLVRISRSFDNGTFAKKAQWQELVSNLKGKLHLLGLVSPGGVHSHTDHLYKIV